MKIAVLLPINSEVFCEKIVDISKEDIHLMDTSWKPLSIERMHMKTQCKIMPQQMNLLDFFFIKQF